MRSVCSDRWAVAAAAHVSSRFASEHASARAQHFFNLLILSRSDEHEYPPTNRVRARLVKPGFFRNEELCNLPFVARLAFAGLWLCSDREGRLEDRPKRLKADIFPYDDVDMNALIQQLHEQRFVLRYVSGQDHYIQILRFSKHQYPHIKEPASTIPAPCENSARTVQAPDKNSFRPSDTDTDTDTERDRDLSNSSVIYTVAAPTNGNGRASHGSLSPVSDPFTDKSITQRAGKFIERYKVLYSEHRKGARYACQPVRDYAASVRLCETWDDDTRLDRLAVIFLNSDHKFAEEGSRTIPQFLALASWCDGRLAEHESQVKS